MVSRTEGGEVGVGRTCAVREELREGCGDAEVGRCGIRTRINDDVVRRSDAKRANEAPAAREHERHTEAAQTRSERSSLVGAELRRNHSGKRCPECVVVEGCCCACDCTHAHARVQRCYTGSNSLGTWAPAVRHGVHKEVRATICCIHARAVDDRHGSHARQHQSLQRLCAHCRRAHHTHLRALQRLLCVLSPDSQLSIISCSIYACVFFFDFFFFHFVLVPCFVEKKKKEGKKRKQSVTHSVLFSSSSSAFHSSPSSSPSSPSTSSLKSSWRMGMYEGRRGRERWVTVMWSKAHMRGGAGRARASGGSAGKPRA